MANAIASQVAQTMKAQSKSTKAVTTASKAKTAAKSGDKPAAKPAASRITHALITGRPTSGAWLFAYTAGWMELTGFDKGVPTDKAIVQIVAGNTAIAHHVSNGRFELVAGKLRLTEGGKIHFAKRANMIDPDIKKAFQKVLTTGLPDGVVVKNKECIRAL